MNSSKSTPLLSICIPTYNRKHLLKITLQSLFDSVHLASNWKEFIEIVVSDNGSTDNSPGFIKSLHTKNHIHRAVFSEENLGIDQNIINVISAAKGKYVLLFSDDDLMPKNGIRKIMHALTKLAPICMCLNHFSFSSSPLNPISPAFLPKQQVAFQSGEKFFSYCGLGFLSSLVFEREKASPFLTEVNIGKECAHLEVTSKIALTHKGSFVFLGDVIIAGRSVTSPRYNPVCSSILYQAHTLDVLKSDYNLSLKTYQHLKEKLLKKDLPRILYKMIKLKQPIDPYRNELSQTFSSHKFYKLIDFCFFSFWKKPSYFLMSILYHLVKAKRKICKRAASQKDLFA